jgi:hypothetical protein
LTNRVIFIFNFSYRPVVELTEADAEESESCTIDPPNYTIQVRQPYNSRKVVKRRLSPRVQIVAGSYSFSNNLLETNKFSEILKNVTNIFN